MPPSEWHKGVGLKFMSLLTLCTVLHFPFVKSTLPIWGGSGFPTTHMFMPGSYKVCQGLRGMVLCGFILQEHVQKYVLGGSTLKVDSQLVSDTLFRPVRALIDRGGKAGCFLIQFIFCPLFGVSYYKHISTYLYIFWSTHIIFIYIIYMHIIFSSEFLFVVLL